LYISSDPVNQLTYVLTDNIPTSPSVFDTKDQRRDISGGRSNGQIGSKNDAI